MWKNKLSKEAYFVNVIFKRLVVASSVALCYKLTFQSSIFDLIQLDYLILSQIVPVFGSIYDIIMFKDTCGTHA